MEDYRWMAVQGLQFEVEAVETPSDVTPSIDKFRVRLLCPLQVRQVRLAWIAGPHEAPLQAGDTVTLDDWDATAVFVIRAGDAPGHSLATPSDVPDRVGFPPRTRG